MTDMTRQDFEPVEAFTITIDGAVSTSKYLSDQVTNTVHAKSIMVYGKITPDVSTTAGQTIRFYLIRDDQHPTNAYRSEGVGTSAVGSASTNATNAEFIGSMTFRGADATAHTVDFVVENVGPKFSILMEPNVTGALAGAEQDNYLRYRFIT